MSEQEDRRFYYFYNENFAETEIPESQLRGQGLDAKLTSKVYKVESVETETKSENG